ncbi:MAG: N-6 DNA methylase [Actinomycetota bacterium]
MTAAADRRWAVAASRSLGPDHTPEAAAAAVARGVAAAIGPHAVEALAAVGLATKGPDETRQALDGIGQPGAGWADPWLIGQVHEQAASPAERQRRGAWYTPRSVVGGLTAAAFDAWGPTPPPLVVDPTCGGGAFLLAALDRLVAMGVAPADAVARTVGLDLDPTAVRVTRWSLALWAAAAIRSGPGDVLPPNALEVAMGDINDSCGDAVTDIAYGW